MLVLRLATSHSVEGRLLKRARSKLALERLVIKKGAFLHQEVRARACAGVMWGSMRQSMRRCCHGLKAAVPMSSRCSVQALHPVCKPLCVTRGSCLQGVQDDTKTSMKAEELVEILKGEGDRKEKDVAQSGVISEEVGEIPCQLPCGIFS